MTTPDFEGIMPYGATYTPVAGSSTMTTTSTNSHMSGYNVNLDPGPMQVQTTWTGEEQCELYLRRNGQLIKLSSIDAKSGGGVRAPAIVQFGALAGDQLYLYIRGGWGGKGAPTGTITVIPTAT